MRDLQVSIAAYHDASAGFHSDAVAFETPARAAVGFVQKINDVLRSQIGQQDKYKRIFKRELDAGHEGAELIEGFRYVRNATAHQLLGTGSRTTAVGGGLGLGYLTAACWDPIPRRVHNRLHPSTQALKQYYDRVLVDHLVLDTLLDAAAYFATVCPLIVHRDGRAEWTGFPLRSQPGVSTRLHPTEPPLDPASHESRAANARWLNGRSPGGDFRLICGRANVDGGDLLFGLTFRGSASFSPFVETAQQVRLDLTSGYAYHQAAGPAPLQLKELGPYRHGDTIGAYVSEKPLDGWVGAPLRSIEHIDHFASVMTEDQWEHQIHVDLMDHLVRRSQRLAAVYPPA